ncbi:molybdenum cofactor guanylyltransferase [Acanthopleuribacter pedis]|uniref:NTP transferase domain-containing protein n=1 Tax=Acanthopleuribacter pedis TaxID=442870 RepID=A0A8J7QEW8_9BACT|nr:NTP transferase domain-containing protein [Acanthopleuribacter pedis]MBO1317110.1 NTP transferase domain-containing protein [Acanthopleuribacter pedis]
MVPVPAARVEQAVILIGGGSTRMGRDKASIPREGLPQALYLAHLLRPFSARAPLWLGRPSPELAQHQARLAPDIRWLADPTPERQGPAAGLAALYAGSDAADFLVLAVDLFWLTEPAIAWLLALRSGRRAVRPLLPGRPFGEPLCAWYRRDALTAMVARFDAGERAVSRALDPATGCDVPVPAALVPCFRNGNEPEALRDGGFSLM